jgi:hypothetical protein
MASELNVSASLEYSKNGNEISKFETKTVNVTGTNFVQLNQSIGFDREEIIINGGNAFGDIGTAGYVLLKNLDATNYITLYMKAEDTWLPFAKLNAGEIALFRVANDVYDVWAQANAAACELEITMIEN